MVDHDLRSVQRVVADAVRERRPQHEAADALVVPSPRGMTPADRVEVYREQYWVRHERNLSDDYPTLAWALGGTLPFLELVRDYLGAFPPRTWDLQRLGRDMPAFVQAQRSHDALSIDAARLDWAFMVAFDAPDATFDPRVLATMPEDRWPAARLELHPSVSLVALAHPLLEVRDALRAGTATPERPLPSPVHAVVWRDGTCHLHGAAIEAPAFELLTRLHASEPLGGACEAVATSSGLGEAALGERVGGWFQEWTSRGWLARIVVA